MSSLPSFEALRRDNTPTAASMCILSSCSGAISATKPSVRVFLAPNGSNPVYIAQGPPFRCSRGHRQVATQTKRAKMEKECGRYSYLYCRHSVSYLTLMAGDKGIKCPSVSPNQCKQRPSGVPPIATMAFSSAPLATVHPWLHSLSPRAPGRAPERHVGGCAGARVRCGRLPRQVACRGRCLVGLGSLSFTEPCRGAWRVAASFLETPWLAFPASSSCWGLVFLV